MPSIDIRIPPTLTVETGDISVTLEQPEAGELETFTGESTDTAGFTIPAGAFSLRVKNVGSAIEGGADESISVNGLPLAPGQESPPFQAIYVPSAGTAGIFYSLPEIVVLNPDGAGVWYEGTRPS